MRIYNGAVLLAAMGTTSFAGVPSVQINSNRSVASQAVTALNPEHWQTPYEASSADRLSMLEWFRLNELCRGSSDAATIESTCPKRDRLNTSLEQRGWCWAYDEPAASSSDDRWHRCTQKLRPLAQTNNDPYRSLPIDQGDRALVKSATKQRDIGGFALGMFIDDAAKLSPLEKIADNDYRTTKNGFDYDFGVTRLGRIFRVDSTQNLGEFAVDDIFRQSLLAKLTAKYGPPQTTTVDTFYWSLVELVKSTGERALPFETNWASVYLEHGAESVTLHVKLLDFRIAWRDDAQINQTPRGNAVEAIAL